MAEAMTFDSLKLDMRRYLERGSIVDTEVYEQIPRLIGLAERAIATQLKILGFIDSVTADLIPGVSVYQKPDRWRKTVSIQFGTDAAGALPGNSRKFIYPRSLEYCRFYWPDSDERDIPEYYADYNYEHWLIVPTPVAAFPWEIIYYQLPPLLGDTNQTNWLTDYAPNALLYRALLEATPFLKNDERIPVWQQMYNDYVGALTEQDLKRIIDRTSTRQEA